MRKPLTAVTLAFIVLPGLGGCASSPLPAHDPQLAWVDMYTTTGKLVMAQSLDTQRLADGRYFQVTPGQHELMVRFDFETPAASGFSNDPQERLCYLTLRYDHFEAGQRYRLEGISNGFNARARLYNAQREIVARDRMVNCVP